MSKLPPFPLFSPPATPADDETLYYAAIGKLIVAYATAESAVHRIARHLTRLNDDKARVIFGGMRIGEVVTRSRALLRLAKRSKKIERDIMDCLDQFDIVGVARDKLVHRFVDYEGGQIIVTNIFTAKSILSFERELFTITDLSNMQLDCHVIFLRLSHVSYPERRKTASKPFLKSLQVPWRYKPVQPKTDKK